MLGMMETTQVAARLEDAVVDFLDDLVDEGRFASRADVVRFAVARLHEAERRRAAGAAIARGYERLPQSDGQVDVAEANLRRLLAEESW